MVIGAKILILGEMPLFGLKVGKMGVCQMGVGEQEPIPLLYTRLVNSDCAWN